MSQGKSMLIGMPSILSQNLGQNLEITSRICARGNACNFLNQQSPDVSIDRLRLPPDA